MIYTKCLYNKLDTNYEILHQIYLVMIGGIIKNNVLYSNTDII